MASRSQVQALIATGADYETAAARLGISAGEAYLIATGRPADGSDSRWYAAADRPISEEPAGAVGARRTPRPASPQQLLGVPAHNPTRNDRVDAWVRARAARELTPRP